MRRCAWLACITWTCFMQCARSLCVCAGLSCRHRSAWAAGVSQLPHGRPDGGPPGLLCPPPLQAPPPHCAHPQGKHPSPTPPPLPLAPLVIPRLAHSHPVTTPHQHPWHTPTGIHPRLAHSQSCGLSTEVSLVTKECFYCLSRGSSFWPAHRCLPYP